MAKKIKSYFNFLNKHLSVWSTFFILVSTSSAAAEWSVPISWDPVIGVAGQPDPSVAGYEIGWGETSGNYTHVIDVGNSLSAPVSFPSVGPYFLAVRAYTYQNMLSDWSTEIMLGDADNDLIENSLDCARYDPSAWRNRVYPDPDGDGTRSSYSFLRIDCFGELPPVEYRTHYTANETALDNCPDNYNPNQEDNDQDGIGNECDEDYRTIQPARCSVDKDINSAVPLKISSSIYMFDPASLEILDSASYKSGTPLISDYLAAPSEIPTVGKLEVALLKSYRVDRKTRSYNWGLPRVTLSGIGQLIFGKSGSKSFSCRYDNDNLTDPATVKTSRSGAEFQFFGSVDQKAHIVNVTGLGTIKEIFCEDYDNDGRDELFIIHTSPIIPETKAKQSRYYSILSVLDGKVIKSNAITSSASFASAIDSNGDGEKERCFATKFRKVIDGKKKYASLLHCIRSDKIVSTEVPRIKYLIGGNYLKDGHESFAFIGYYDKKLYLASLDGDLVQVPLEQAFSSIYTKPKTLSSRLKSIKFVNCR